MSNPRVLAIYLPQYHRIKENDTMWGDGFTEWVNVAKARPIYKGHYQPQLPSELGFYDLTYDKVRNEQARLAKEFGIEGFCYWHYWFGKGRRILEQPIEEVIKTGKPDFPFCFAWANHSWTTSTWNNSSTKYRDKEFIKQEYLGIDDYIEHFNALLPAFKDRRYIRVDGKLLFAIYNPAGIPDDELGLFIKTWNYLAAENGIGGFHFVARVSTVMRLTDADVKERINGSFKNYYEHYLNMGFDAIWSDNKRRAEILSKGYNYFFIRRALYHAFNLRIPSKYSYKAIIDHWLTSEDANENVYPTIMPRWDRTPREGKIAEIYTDNSPELFAKHLSMELKIVQNKAPEHQILFLQSWNEWGEGNYIEPDVKYGREYLEVVKRELEKSKGLKE